MEVSHFGTNQWCTDWGGGVIQEKSITHLRTGISADVSCSVCL